MVQGSRQPRPGGAVKAERYRATEPYPWEYRVTDLLEGRYVATCTIEGMAEVIAAALNAAEDAGRWKAALELVEFKAREGHSHRSLAATARAGLNGHDLRRALATTLSRHEARQALKAPEPKEATT